MGAKKLKDLNAATTHKVVDNVVVELGTKSPHPRLPGKIQKFCFPDCSRLIKIATGWGKSDLAPGRECGMRGV